MSLLFADIYDGIRYIRITKGVCEKDILNYVQEKVGGCMKVGNVLKTIKTIKDLVDEGILVRKGKRYSFASKSKRREEEDDDDDEDDECQEEGLDMPDDECDECGGNGGNGGNGGSECERPKNARNACEDDYGGEGQDGGDGQDGCDGQDGGDGQEGGEEEDDEEEDDDDEEEDDDDDDEDDDDEECDENEEQSTAGDKESKCDSAEKMNDNNTPNGKNLNNDNCNSCDNDGNGKMEKKIKGLSDNGKKQVCEKSGRKSKGKGMIEQDGGDGAGKGSEAIAFCVRDFIDSLGRPATEEKVQESTQKSVEILEENMDSVNTFEFGRQFSMKKKGLRNKRRNGRSKSPTKRMQSDLYHCLRKGNSVDLGFRAICSDLFQEPADIDMEGDQEKEEENPSSYPSNPPSNDLKRLESRCEESGDKVYDVVKIERSYNDFGERLTKKNSLVCQIQNDCTMEPMTWFPLEEREKDEEPLKRSLSYEDDRNGDEEKSVSLCSVCEKKKKRNS